VRGVLEVGGELSGASGGARCIDGNVFAGAELRGESAVTVEAENLKLGGDAIEGVVVVVEVEEYTLSHESWLGQGFPTEQRTGEGLSRCRLS
jgi:hypothetical protein